MLNDLFVLNRIKEGDINAFEEIFKLYYTPLCLYAASITGRKEAAEEIVQELFYVFWKEKGKIRLLLSLKSYLYGAIHNRSLQYLEHQEVCYRHQQAVLSAETEHASNSPQEELEYKELQALINNTLQKLPERRLRIFKMHRFEGKKYAEIALALALSVKTVEAEMTKALQTLRTEIENYTRIA